MQIARRVFPLPPFIPEQRNKNIISLRLTMLSPHVDSQLCNGDLHATKEQPSVARKAAKIFPLYCTPFAAQASVARHLPLLCLHPSAPATVIPETFPTDTGSPTSVWHEHFLSRARPVEMSKTCCYLGLLDAPSRKTFVPDIQSCMWKAHSASLDSLGDAVWATKRPIWSVFMPGSRISERVHKGELLILAFFLSISSKKHTSPPEPFTKRKVFLQLDMMQWII